MTTSIDACVAALQGGFLGRPFGEIRFWGFAVVRPHDQSFELVAAQAVGDRLDLTLRDASGQGQTSVLSITGPDGLSISPAGVVLNRAERLVMDDCEAWPDGELRYGLRTPRGEGGFEVQGRPALTLGV